ncbi:MAG: hypothetical protein HXX10_08095 [Rhodoplanes sp.]|uniref:hypothetical protein n=1 Tax=Rhodoplanes sp. TaxID=1968906 RepID=UPI001818E305|nr:hypothetical protein [Rhodoplanes sp.]NVO13983.1 hypothetical protein [Rhodoplanes sp.]
MSNAPSPFLDSREEMPVGRADREHVGTAARGHEASNDDSDARHPDHGAIAYCVRNHLI